MYPVWLALAMSAAPSWLATGQFRWTMSEPLLAPAIRADDPCFSVKDPSIVRYGDRWHLFITIRGTKRSHQIEYLTFADWADLPTAEHAILTTPSDGYFCAPQVFWFAPHRLWYLLCQASDEAWEPNYAAAYSTNPNIADPAGWTPLKPLGANRAGEKAGLDFWIICDDAKAHLFFTTLDGRMWREETALGDFPHGWGEPRLALQGDIFEASHTYRLLGQERYLTLVEAQGGHGWRYQKAYLADRLEGPWTPLADSRDRSLASMANVAHPPARWTDCISHGELLRAGHDQRLEVDPAELRMVIQGVLDGDREGLPYGQIPWRLGLLTLAE